MANWDTLNREFDEVIDNLTTKDWNDWYDKTAKQKKSCKIQMILEATDALNKLKEKMFNKIKNKMETKKEKKFVIETTSGDVEVTGARIDASVGTYRVYVIGLNDEVVAVVPPNRLVYEVEK